jgi:hypothetical protein
MLVDFIILGFVVVYLQSQVKIYTLAVFRLIPLNIFLIATRLAGACGAQSYPVSLKGHLYGE